MKTTTRTTRKTTKVDVRPRTCRKWISAWTFLLVALVSSCIHVQATTGTATATDKSCGGALGLESGSLPDSTLSASSFYVSAVGPQQARLNSDGAWCPREPIAPGVYEWIQVDLPRVQLVTGVSTQGRYAKGVGQEYTQQYTLQYARNSDREYDDHDHDETTTNATATATTRFRWRNYVRFDGEPVLGANSDTSSTVTQTLRPAIRASSIRLVPYSPHLRTVCLRFELLGCSWTNEVVAYSMPQGQMFSHAISLKDNTYDGVGGAAARSQTTQKQKQQPQLNEDDSQPQEEEMLGRDPPAPQTQEQDAPAPEPEEAPIAAAAAKEAEADGGFLSGGIGQLVDGLVGLNSFGMDIGYGLGNAWVGWSRHVTPQQPHPHPPGSSRRDHIEITFELDTVRRVRSVTLHSNNFPSKGVEVFAKAVLQFSVGGVHFPTRNSFSYTPSNIAQYGDSARNETINLPQPGLIGKYVRLVLFFRGEWLLLSEVYFESEVAAGNFTKETRARAGSGAAGGDELQMDFPDTQSSLEVLQGQGSSALEISIGVVSGVLLLTLVGAGVAIWIRHSRKGTQPGGGGSDPETLTPTFDCCASLKLFGYPSDRMAWRFVPRNGSASASANGYNDTPPMGCRDHHVTSTPPTSTATTDDSLVKDMLVTLSSLNNPGYTNTAAVLLPQSQRDAANTTPPPKYSTLSLSHGQGHALLGGGGSPSPILHQYDNYGSTHYRKPKPMPHPHAMARHSPHILPYSSPNPLGHGHDLEGQSQSAAARVLTLRRNQLLQEIERQRSQNQSPSEFGDVDHDHDGDGDADIEDDQDYEYEGLLERYARSTASTHAHGHHPRDRDRGANLGTGTGVMPSRRNLDISTSTSRRHQHQRRTLEHESFRHGHTNTHTQHRNERPI